MNFHHKINTRYKVDIINNDNNELIMKRMKKNFFLKTDNIYEK